jgi:hypothetical protein
MDVYDKYHKYKHKYLGGAGGSGAPSLKVTKNTRYDIHGNPHTLKNLIGLKIQLTYNGGVSTWRVLNYIPMLTGATLILVVPPRYFYDDTRNLITTLPPNENHADIPDKSIYRYNRRDDPNYREGAKVVHLHNGKNGIPFEIVFEMGLGTPDRVD